MNVCFRPGTPIHEQQPHASHVLILTNMDQFLLHFLGIIVCYMEKKKKRLHIVLFYIKGPSLAPLQNTIPAWTKQQVLTVPPYNNELGNCLLKRVTSHVLDCIPKHEVKSQSFSLGFSKGKWKKMDKWNTTQKLWNTLC